MSNGNLNIWKIIGILILCFIGYKIVVGAVALAIKLAVPVLIVGGIGYMIYRSSTGKPLLGGRKTLP
jgi:predicted RND superfamily exporter protein